MAIERRTHNLRLRLLSGLILGGGFGSKLEEVNAISWSWQMRAVRRHTSAAARLPSLLSTESCSQTRQQLPFSALLELHHGSSLSSGPGISRPIL